MLKNCSATVFMRKTDGFETKRFENAYVYEEKKISSEDGGHVCRDNAVLRIFTTDGLPVKCGDFVVFYLSDSISPPKNCYTVTAVCDNRHCSQSHYRITAVQ